MEGRRITDTDGTRNSHAAGAVQNGKPPRREAIHEGIIPGQEKFLPLLERIPLTSSPYIFRPGAAIALLDLARKHDLNPRELDKFVRECIEDGKNPKAGARGEWPLDRYLTMLGLHFDAGLKSVSPYTTVAEFGRDVGEGTFYGTSFFVDMEGFTKTTKKATGQTIGMLMRAQDVMFRLAGMETGTITDNFTGDGRNTITIKASKFKSVIDAIMFGMMNVELVEKFNRINMETWELGMLEGAELRIRQGENDGVTSIRETSGRHTTYSAATNLAARIMSHGESGKLVISESMAKVAYKHFKLSRRVLGQTVMEEIEKFKKCAEEDDAAYKALGNEAKAEDKKLALMKLFTSTYMVQLLSDKLDSEFGGENRKGNQKWIRMNDEAEDALGGLGLSRDKIDELKRDIRETVNNNGAYSRSLKGFKGFKEVKAYYVVEGVRDAQDDPYIFPVGSKIRKEYLGECKASGGKGRALDEYIDSVAIRHGATSNIAPNMFMPYPILGVDMLDGEVGASKNRAVMAVCAFRELVKRVASSPQEELEGKLLEKVSNELRGLGVISESGEINEEKMLEVEKKYVLLPALMLEIGKCRIADKMFGAPETPSDERAKKRVARTHTVLTSNPAIIGNTLEDEKMAKLDEIPRISAGMLRDEHNERYSGYFEKFDNATLRVLEHTENGNKWREDLAQLESGGVENPALTVACSQVVQVSHQLVREIMGRPWSQTFEPVDTVIKSTIERYEIDRNETVHRDISDITRDLLWSKGVSCKVYKDTELFPEAA